MLLHLFSISIFPFAVCIFCIKVIFSKGRNEWRRNLFVVKLVPVYIAEPQMVFHLLRTIQPESTCRFSLNKFVNKICSFTWPSLRYLLLLYLNLFRKNVISDFFSIFALVRPFSVHALICNYSHCEIINCHAMILSTHYFWRHISGCTWSIFSVFWVPNSSNTKISDSKVPIFIKH